MPGDKAMDKLTFAIRRGPLAIVGVSLILLGSSEGMAFILDPPPQAMILPSGTNAVLLAQAARRKHGRGRGARSKAKPTTKPEAPEEAPSPPKEDAPAATPSPESLQRGGRVEFDGRLVQGQTAKSGAIYLFARPRTNLKSMVRERANYRKEILRTVTSRWVKAP
jgi:hypothetical protein